MTKNINKSETKPAVRPLRIVGKTVFAVSLIAVLGGIAWVRLQQEATYGVSSQKQEETNAVVVARTDPEVGEVLPSTIIKTDAETNANQETEIEVLDPPQLSAPQKIAEPEAVQIVDVTEQVATPKQERTQRPTQPIQAAALAQTTLKLAQVSQSQQLRLAMLYTAYNTSAPEVHQLLAQAQKNAATERQQTLLAELAKATEHYGPISPKKVYMKLYRHGKKGKSMDTKPKEIPQSASSWWDRTWASLVTVKKLDENGVGYTSRDNKTPQKKTLKHALKQGDWHQVEMLLQEEPYNGADYARVRALIQTYQKQRQLWAQLLQETFSE
ncbi:MAG: hypothetical protein OXR68_01270 [Alphaproteobacteria bacterium]|nr:hypothetical protein [Alphaproteobacteria bacterium]MDD9919241.1 hypothetical protein [Alphaproteobacteria bacterium]